MITKVRKWGNSLAVRLPGVIVRQFEIEDGATVTLTPDRDQLVLRPQLRTRRRKRVALVQLVSRMSKKNQHTLLSWEAPVGREVW